MKGATMPRAVSSETPLPPNVEVARKLLWVESLALLVGLLALMFWVQATAPPHGLSNETSAAVWTVIGTIVGAAALLASRRCGSVSAASSAGWWPCSPRWPWLRFPRTRRP